MGHSDRTFAEFVALLQAYGIGLVADIRSLPGSRHVPWTDAEVLAPALEAHRIGYRHLSALGGRRRPRADSPNGGWRNAAFRGYADHMLTPEFAAALAELLATAATVPTALMCAEAVPWRCHRSLVADALVVRGVEVVEILSLTDSRPHALTPFAHVAGTVVTYPPDEAER